MARRGSGERSHGHWHGEEKLHLGNSVMHRGGSMGQAIEHESAGVV
jgi:hypothetical protein